MKKSRFSESQIVSILKEADAGLKVSEICRKHGISDATYYNWKAKYGGMAVSDLKRMKEMEAELAQLKRMYADLALENRAMKDLIEKSFEATGEARCGQIHDRGAWLVGGQKLSLCRLVTRGLLPSASRSAQTRSRRD
jgi:putative transposase